VGPSPLHEYGKEEKSSVRLQFHYANGWKYKVQFELPIQRPRYSLSLVLLMVPLSKMRGSSGFSVASVRFPPIRPKPVVISQWTLFAGICMSGIHDLRPRDHTHAERQERYSSMHPSGSSTLSSFCKLARSLTDLSHFNCPATF